MKIRTYLLTKANNNQEPIDTEQLLANSGAAPICFNSSYAESLFEFAESNIDCMEGDEILLLEGDIDVDSIQDNENFAKAFKQLVGKQSDKRTWSIIKSKIAQSPNSDEFRAKVHQELRATQSRIRSSVAH